MSVHLTTSVYFCRWTVTWSFIVDKKTALWKQWRWIKLTWAAWCWPKPCCTMDVETSLIITSSLKVREVAVGHKRSHEYHTTRICFDLKLLFTQGAQRSGVCWRRPRSSAVSERKPLFLRAMWRWRSPIWTFVLETTLTWHCSLRTTVTSAALLTCTSPEPWCIIPESRVPRCCLKLPKSNWIHCRVSKWWWERA